MTLLNTDYDTLSKIFTAWWRSLQSIDKTGRAVPVGDAFKAPNRAALAELRRIGQVDESGFPKVDITRALSIAAFRNLIMRLRNEPSLSYVVKSWTDPEKPTIEPLVIAAVTLARVRSDLNLNDKRGVTASLLGASRGDADGQPLYSEARFKRLIRCRNDWPGLLAQARRIAAILEKQAPVGDLGASLALWNSDPHIIREWTFQYYQRDFQASANSEDKPAAA